MTRHHPERAPEDAAGGGTAPGGSTGAATLAPEPGQAPGGTASGTTEPAKGPADSPPPGTTPATGPASGDRRLAVLAYLAVPLLVFLVPLAVYLAALRRSRWLREHAAQAFNAWVTFVLYGLSLGIMGLMLALDTPQVGITAGAAAVALLWAVTVVFLARAAYAASRGRQRTLPHWLCSHLFR